MLDLTECDFTGQTLKSFPNGTVVVVFKAEWCGFCKKLSPELPKLDTALLNKAKIGIVDYDKSRNLVNSINKVVGGYRIKSLPTIVFYKNGKMVSEYLGARTADSISKEVVKYL